LDSRDIKEEPGIIPEHKYLEEIYQMQKNLLSGYIGIEGLPQYPVDINTKASQTLLKDFTARVIEELSEGYESFENVMDLFEANHSRLVQTHGDCIEYMEILNHLQNANEENADAIHFFIELLIYANIQPDDIKSYMVKWVRDNRCPQSVVDSLNKIHEDILRTAMNLGVMWIMDKGDIGVIFHNNATDLIKWYENMDSETLLDYNTKLLEGGRYFNHVEYSVNYPYLLWKITHHLNIARNFLKNKPWKQSQVMTQELKYQAELVKAFIYFCGYLGWIGMDSKEVFYIYFKKNHINLFRQKSKY
jgi:hypothetical protein